jgi:hypothetical protein
MAWCDPCAADPLSREELRQLGVFWLEGGGPGVTPGGITPRRAPMPSGAQEVFLTRLHVRYDAAHFPEDLAFQETGDRQNFQARYVLRHPWKAEIACPAGDQYRQQLARRQEAEAQALATLTGWSIDDIRRGIGVTAPDDRKWWQKLWGD